MLSCVLSLERDDVCVGLYFKGEHGWDVTTYFVCFSDYHSVCPVSISIREEKSNRIEM